MITNLIRVIAAVAVVTFGLALPFSYAGPQNPFGGEAGDTEKADVVESPAHQDNPDSAKTHSDKVSEPVTVDSDKAPGDVNVETDKVTDAIKIHTDNVQKDLEKDVASHEVYKKATPVSDSMPPDVEKDAKTEPVLSGKKLVGRIVWAKGTVTAKDKADPNDTLRKLKKHSNIYGNDLIKTQPRSTAQVVFRDDSSMSFRPDTEFTVDEFDYKVGGDKTKSKSVVGLVTGGFRTITGKVAKDNPDEYQVVTPVATIGVRGTEFSVVYKDGEGLKIKRYKGKPCVTNVPKAGNKNKKKKTLCLDGKNQYAEVDSQGNFPVALAQQPEVFAWDVSIIPVSFGQPGGGIGGSIDGINGLGGGGFCIQ